MTEGCVAVMMARAEKVCGKERRSPVGRVSKARMVKEGTLAVLARGWEMAAAHRKSSHAPCVITSAALCPAGHCFPAGTPDSSMFQSGSLSLFHFRFIFTSTFTMIAFLSTTPITEGSRSLSMHTAGDPRTNLAAGRSNPSRSQSPSGTCHTEQDPAFQMPHPLPIAPRR